MPSFDFPEIPLAAESIKITVHGEPVPKGRPRGKIVTPFHKKPFISFYQPSETVAYEQRVAQEAFLVMRGKGLLVGALALDMRVYLTVPKSWSIRLTQNALHGITRPTGRPDCDNFLKIIDALNGVVWKDDAQIVRMSVEKHYSDRPRLEIEIFAV